MQPETDPSLIELIKQYAGYIWGLVGAAVSLMLGDNKGLLRRQIVTAYLGGVATAWVAFSVLVSKLGIPEGLAGFLLGAFGMLILSRIYAAIQTADLTGALNKWLGNKAGKDDKPPGGSP